MISDINNRPSKMKNIFRAILFLPSLLIGQTFSGGFPFSLPFNDTTAQQFLPAFPAAGIDGQSFIGIDADGHFARNGSPIRFWGTNIVATGAFPEKKYAPAIAGRLRKMGFNLLRFHHLDNAWGSGTSLFDYGSDTRHLNADRLDKLDCLISALKRNGIFANINLHVARVFSALDGVPDADSIARFGPEMSKGIYYFDPQIRSLNKEYARQLLTHVNPYTGLPLASDPVMAMVELTNEDMLLRMWHAGELRPYAVGGTLTIRHTKMLDSLWNVFLKRKYATASAFASAWNAGAADEGTDNRVRNSGFESLPIASPWQLEQNSPTLASGAMSADALSPASGIYSAKVAVTSTDGVSWHIQFKQTGLSIVKDSLYVVKFSARSDGARPIDVAVMKESSPYTVYASMPQPSLSTSWKSFSFTFKAPETNTADVRLTFEVAAQKGTYWFDDVVLARSGVQGAASAGDFDLGTVGRVEYADCAGSTDQKVRDISEFYLGLSKDCLRDMKSFVRDTLGVRVPITGTNWYADQAEAATQSEMDYIDNHAYWDHPSFPNMPWSTTDWTISNTAMVKGASWSTFPSLAAGVGMKGKPFTISEYNHPFPNRYQVEGPVFLAAYAAFHGADGVMIFDYNGSSDYLLDYVAGYFDIHRNTALMSLMPSCAYAYRSGLIAQARQMLLIDFAQRDILMMPKDNAPVLFNKTIALEHGLRVSGYDAASTTATGFAAAGSNATDTREIVWNTQGMLTAAAPRFAAATGFFASMPGQSAGPMTVTAATDFAAITWLSLTDDSLSASRRSLLTLSTRVQNTNELWDGTQTIHDQWGTSPTEMQAVRVQLRLRLAADSIRVYPLGVKGEAHAAPATVLPSVSDGNEFDVTLDQAETRSVWYGIEAFGAGATASAGIEGESVPKGFALQQNYPNPFNPSTTIVYDLPKPCHATLTVRDLLGREVATLVNGVQAAGRHAAVFGVGGRPIASGMYFYQLRADGHAAQRTMLIIK
jgi:hypothetical protein